MNVRALGVLVGAVLLASIGVALTMSMLVWWSPGMGAWGAGPRGAGPAAGPMAEHMRWMMGGFATGSTTLTQGSATQAIAMKDFAFSPGNVQVPVGARVTWTNEDDAPHLAAAVDGKWSTPVLRKGQRASITFEQAGDYLYVCTIHPGMTGRLLVQ